MLKIGDFARRSQVSVDTLRYYDTLGLLKPSDVDPFTGYRYYDFYQLGRLNRILALKDLGLSLEQIASMLESDVSAEQLKKMLKLKQTEIELTIDAEYERLARVEARLKQIEMEANMPNHEVIIKVLKPLLVASIHRVEPTRDRIVSLFDELNAHLAKHGVTPSSPMTIWHDKSYRETDVDMEAAVAVKTAAPGIAAAVNVYELPGGSVASTVHNGSYNRLGEAYDAINAWVESNGYRVAGPAREIYLYYPEQDPLRMDDESYVTEIQFLVEKVDMPQFTGRD